jgi:hypothetical protein
MREEPVAEENTGEILAGLIVQASMELMCAIRVEESDACK